MSRSPTLPPEDTPRQRSDEYKRLWKIVNGAVKQAFDAHPEYLTREGVRFNSARNSVVKRVVGIIYPVIEQGEPR